MQPLTFPVILENQFGASAFSGQSTLGKCGESWVDHGNMIGSYVIDASGKVFRISGVTKIRNVGFLPRWLISPGRRMVQVDYELDFIDELDVTGLKKRMQELFTRLRGPHDVGLVTEIGTARTIAEIIETIGID